MNKSLANATVSEMTSHIRGRLAGLPGVTETAVQNLVFGWLRQEQPEVLEVMTADEIAEVIADA